MRQTAILLAVLGLMSGVGCRHIAGKCDCTASPNDVMPPSPSTPYPAQHLLTVPPAGSSAPAPGTPIPMPTPGK